MMKTIKAIVLLFCILLSGCRPVFIIVTKEAPKAPKVNVADSIRIKINQPWKRQTMKCYQSTKMTSDAFRPSALSQWKPLSR